MVGNILGKYFPLLKKSDYNFSLGHAAIFSTTMSILTTIILPHHHHAI